MAAIIKGTTPTIVYTFDAVNVADISTAVMTIKSGSNIVLEKDLSTATVGENTLSWKLSQAETLSDIQSAEVMLNWVLADGTRGASAKTAVTFAPNHKEEVI